MGEDLMELEGGITIRVVREDLLYIFSEAS